MPFEHIAEGLERTVIGARDGSSAAAVVDQSIDGLLQHTLFVADDDVRCLQLDEPLQAVIAVDDAAVEVVEVGGREAAAVQLDHRAQLRRNDRQHVHDHPRRIVAGHPERLDDLKALDDAQLLLAGGVLQLVFQLLGELLQIDLLQKLLHGLGAHACL